MIELVLAGWEQRGIPDQELLRRGMALIEGLYHGLRKPTWSFANGSTLVACDNCVQSRVSSGFTSLTFDAIPSGWTDSIR